MPTLRDYNKISGDNSGRLSRNAQYMRAGCSIFSAVSSRLGGYPFFEGNRQLQVFIAFLQSAPSKPHALAKAMFAKNSMKL
jgi:hypothetical protein